MATRKKILTITLIAVSIAAALFVVLKIFKKSGSGLLSFIPISKPKINLTSLARNLFPLMMGVKSREVALYQAHLNKKADTALTIDGVWGPATEAASKKVHGWSVIDLATYSINIKGKEAELISFAKETQNTIISA